jgi:hypothetical protein
LPWRDSRTVDDVLYVSLDMSPTLHQNAAETTPSIVTVTLGTRIALSIEALWTTL